MFRKLRRFQCEEKITDCIITEYYTEKLQNFSESVYLQTFKLKKISNELVDFFLNQINCLAITTPDYSDVYFLSEKNSEFVFGKYLSTQNCSVFYINAPLKTLTLISKVFENFKIQFQLESPEIEVTWVLNSKNQINSFLKVPEIKQSCYPFLKEDYFTYRDNFFKSESNLLLLLGPPGTGKTNFIKGLFKDKPKSNILTTTNTEVIAEQTIFSTFFEEDYDFLIIEDADLLLKKREQGNDLMSTILNGADGLLSCVNKKIILSTNLPSLKDVDTAVIRKGRCFDILQFRNLSYDEALNVVKDHNLNQKLEKNENYSLAQLFNPEEDKNISRDNLVKNLTSFGFNN